MAYTYVPGWILMFITFNKKILKPEFESTPYFYLVSQINQANMKKIVFLIHSSCIIKITSSKKSSNKNKSSHWKIMSLLHPLS